jgi:predicted dehydrogenase
MLPGFLVTAVATTHQESADETAAAFGISSAFGDARDLVASSEVDVVSICVKVPHHADYVRSVVEAGKGVYCEWPLGRNLDEATELTALATRRGVPNAVGLQARTSPLINTAKDLVAEGHIGKVLSASLSFAGPGLGGPAYPEAIAWQTDRSNGANPLTVFGGHYIDGFRYILGEPRELGALVAVRHPSATILESGERIAVSAPDVVLAHGLLDSGAFFTFNIQATLPHGEGVVLDVQGSEGALKISGGSLNMDDGPLSLRVIRKGVAGTISPRAKYQLLPDDATPGPARNIARLYLALQAGMTDGTPIVPNFDTALSLHRLIDAIETASETGTRQSL